MSLHFRSLVVLLSAALLCVGWTSAGAMTVGTGPSIDFVRLPNADPTLAENQDRITDTVWITRGAIQGLFNFAREDGYSDSSPAGTQWAFQGLNGNPTEGFSAAEFASLNFSTWTQALEEKVGDNILFRSGVVHLVDEDVYLDIVFTGWGVATTGGGSFAYTRSSIIPLPAAVWLFASALSLLGGVRSTAS